MAWDAAFIVTVPDAVRAATVVVPVNVVPPEATVAMVAPPTSRMWPWSDLIVSLVVSAASCSILSPSSSTVPAAFTIGSVVAMNRSAAIDPRGKPIGPRRPFAMSRSHQRGFFLGINTKRCRTPGRCVSARPRFEPSVGPPAPIGRLRRCCSEHPRTRPERREPGVVAGVECQFEMSLSELSELSQTRETCVRRRQDDSNRKKRARRISVFILWKIVAFITL